MNRAEEEALLERARQLVQAGEKDLVSTERLQPVAGYLDPERFAAERALFRRLPVVVAASAELPSPGDFLTHDWSGLPLYIARGEDGRARVMLNVCRHRGTRLVGSTAAPERGCRRALVCPYHAWSYGCDGAFRGAPDRAHFPSLDRAPDENGLATLPTEERHGLVWTVLTPGAPLDVAAWLGRLDEDLAGLALARHSLFRPISFEKRLNWKLAFDVFLEAYHLKYAHARSIYKYFFDNLGLFERVGHHMRNLFPKRSIAEIKLTDRSVSKLRDHANVLYTLVPNCFLLAQPDHVSFVQVWPAALDRTRVVVSTLLPADPASRPVEDPGYWDKNVDIFLGAIEEDYALGESIQGGLHSGANRHLRFGRAEQSLAWFHEAVENLLAADGVSPKV
jgi:phenylpropionate dioxygenase-like ring-hydroxylating dioxygenase large terminal subunit